LKVKILKIITIKKKQNEKLISLHLTANHNSIFWPTRRNC
jgi:hypothetical protein